ncbi:hypothetical protein KAH27_01940 [bacterium]|nr:hypothetical protein [bacterium]
MKIALSTFNDNLSVAFDFADSLQIFSVEDGIAKRGNEHLLQNVNSTARAAEIKKLDIEILICGCISRCSYEILTQLGIEVISHVSGTVDKILSAYLNKEISKPEFCMPGFGRRNGRGGRCGQNRGFGRERCMENQ